MPNIDHIVAALENIVDVLSTYQKALDRAVAATEIQQKKMTQRWTDDNAIIFNDRVSDAGKKLFDFAYGVNGIKQQVAAMKADAEAARLFGRANL